MTLVLSGAALVLPDRILTSGTIVVEDGRIAEVRTTAPASSSSSTGPAFAFHNHYIVPGFIDVHVHGVDGVDTLDTNQPVAAMAAALPRYGVTSFCPTAVACDAAALDALLAQVRALRARPPAASARVLPAHLESAFINPAFAGAQPPEHLQPPRDAFESRTSAASQLLQAIERGAPDVGIVTIAPELDSGLDLLRWLVERGIRVSLGHSGATFEEAAAAIAAGARHATHLFNCMPPLDRRAPGLAGAVLQSDDVATEIICDGVHVHPALVRTIVAAKRPSRVMAITDGTAAAGLRPGSSTSLGGRQITVSGGAARLADGTLAGSVMTMDAIFRKLVGDIGLSPVDAATMCATTPARELGLVGHGVITADAIADFVVLDSEWSVVQTYVDGRLIYARNLQEEL